MLKMFKDDRWKSPMLWTSVISQVVAILLLVGAIDLQMGEQVNQIAGLLAQLFVTLGILNNPTDKENW